MFLLKGTDLTIEIRTWGGSFKSRECLAMFTLLPQQATWAQKLEKSAVEPPECPAWTCSITRGIFDVLYY
jgi:hypothetical protein